jgi:phosphate transport system protein
MASQCDRCLGGARYPLDASFELFYKPTSAIPRDEEVDFLHKRLHREANGSMLSQPGMVNTCLNLMVISKSLERIADHATNVAEDVVYLYEGRDIRHMKMIEAK